MVYTRFVLNVLTLNRGVRDGKYAAVMDVCEFLGDGDFGSASNALVAMVQKSPLYYATRTSEDFQEWRTNRGRVEGDDP